jgi:hypothetical protein
MEHLLFKATLAAAVLTFFIILFTRKENNYLSTVAGNTKKLMVVDQTTGAITFLNNSVEGINNQFMNTDAAQTALLKRLFGDNLDGEGGTFKAKMDAAILPLATKIAALEVRATDTEAGGKWGTELRTSLDNTVRKGSGSTYTLMADGQDKNLADDQCDGSAGGGNNQGASWCKSDTNGGAGRAFKVYFT